MKSNISFESSLCKFGIGLFETIKVTDKPMYLDLHMERMFNSVNDLKLKLNCNKKLLEKEILDYINDKKIINKALRITIYDEGYNISTREIVYNKESYQRGFKLNISPIKRGNSLIYRHKTTNYFENIYTKNFANENGFDDGLFLDINGTVLECSMSNIFFIKDKTIITPSGELPILNGTTKKRIKDICGELNIELIEKKINITEIHYYDFVFISNSLMGIMKITQIEDIVYKKENEIFKKILAYL